MALLLVGKGLNCILQATSTEQCNIIVGIVWCQLSSSTSSCDCSPLQKYSLSNGGQPTVVRRREQQVCKPSLCIVCKTWGSLTHSHWINPFAAEYPFKN